MDAVSYIISGSLVTLQFTVVSVVIGLFIGVLLSLCKLSSYRALRWFATLYISIFRGTPLLVQLSIIYFALPGLVGLDVSVFVAGVMAFSMNSGAYVSEIIRAGIQSVDKGQFEAARSLGVPYRHMMKDIVLPQATRNVLPALVNEGVNLLKESALISVIGGADLMRRAQLVAAEQYSYFEPLMIAAGCYYVMVVGLSFCAKKLEQRLEIA